MISECLIKRDAMLCRVERVPLYSALIGCCVSMLNILFLPHDRVSDLTVIVWSGVFALLVWDLLAFLLFVPLLFYPVDLLFPHTCSASILLSWAFPVLSVKQSAPWMSLSSLTCAPLNWFILFIFQPCVFSLSLSDPRLSPSVIFSVFKCLFLFACTSVFHCKYSKTSAPTFPLACYCFFCILVLLRMGDIEITCVNPSHYKNIWEDNPLVCTHQSSSQHWK